MSVQTAEAPPQRVWDLRKFQKQRDFVEDGHRFAVYQGARGTTKTSSACLRILKKIGEFDEHGRLVGVKPEWYGADILVAAPVFKQLKRGPKVKFDEVFDDTGLVIGRTDGNEPRRELMGNITVYFFNVGPQGEGAEAWRGPEYAIAWLDEVAQMPEKAFTLANATLRQRRRDGTFYDYQTILTTTPLGQNWLWRRFLNRTTRLTYRDDTGSPMYPDEKLLIIQAHTRETIDAGFVPPSYIADLGYRPGSLMYQQEVEGKVISTSGLVFDQDWKLISDENPLPKTFRAVYAGVDVGEIAPTAIELVGLDMRGAIWVFKEFYEERARFSKWTNTVGEWAQQHSVRRWFVDSDMTRSLMRGAGLTASPPYKHKDAAQTAVNYINQLIGRGMLNIAPTCYGLLSEMAGYEYRDVFSGDEVTFIDKAKPNQPDHAIDALRYAVLPLSSVGAAENYGREVEVSFG